MDLPIILNGKTVGNCCLEARGLYWYIDARCEVLSDRVERLYCGPRRLGVLEREGDVLTLHRQVSRSAFPELPPKNGTLSLRPAEETTLWTGKVLVWELTGFRQGDVLLFPYREDQPCPCEPLFCFFEIRDGFWRLPLQEKKEKGGE